MSFQSKCSHPEFNLSIQAASRSMGAILIFAFYVLFQRFGFRYVVIAGGLLPALAFLGTLCLHESPIFAQRSILLDHYEYNLLKLTLQDRGNSERALRKCQQSQKSRHALPNDSNGEEAATDPDQEARVVQTAGLDPHHHLPPTFLRLHLHQEVLAPNFGAFEKS